METSSNGHTPHPTEIARSLLMRGMQPVALPFGEKNPNRPGWQTKRYGLDDLADFAPSRLNVGVLLGPPSGGLVDIDLDCPEAIRAARRFLPFTACRWGRASKPGSHWVFFVTDVNSAKDVRFTDPDYAKAHPGAQAMLVEIRYSGQTIYPGSVNTSSGREEVVRFEPGYDGEPTPITFEELLRAVERLAAAALIARRWEEGVRHQLALPLAGLLCDGGMNEREAQDLLEVVCEITADPDPANRLQCLRDTYARAQAGQPYTRGGTLERDYWPEGVIKRLRQWLHLQVSQSTVVGMSGPDGLPLDQTGDGDRFVRRYEGKVIYCHVDDMAFIWDGERWKPDEVQFVYELAKIVADDFQDLFQNTPPRAYGLAGMAGQRECMQWAKRMGDVGRLEAMYKMARTRPALAVTPNQLDAHPLLLNVKNGTLELNITTGHVTLRAPRQEDMLTMQAAAAYVRGARHWLFDEFLDLFYPEPERRRFLQLMAGYALTGLPKRHALQLIGATNAGKSMTLALFAGVLGDYGGSLEYTSLVRNPHAGGDVPRPDLWRERHKRLVVVSEIPPGVKLDVALFKAMLSGSDKIRIRTLYDRTGGVEMTWHSTLWLSGNEPYGPPPHEEAAYDRLFTLRCDHQIAPDDREEAKHQATLNIRQTGEAVLAFMVEGFEMLYGELGGQLIPPEIVRRDRRELRDQLDPWAEVLNNLLEFTGDERYCGMARTPLWEIAKQEWAQVYDERKRIGEKAAYMKSMQSHGASLKKRHNYFNGTEHWTGCVWTDDALSRYRVNDEDWYYVDIPSPEEHEGDGGQENGGV